ncbi:hypothetical protein DCCM_0389 [Desulfocucumis palustris]|uniref:Uncharacterized protein n=1 Tax=Desulfocucumis palustris TaxID=1898651 RepID=A0A2L2X7X1_9FIRM|nr:hypothetical protein [Desulfocucumis palustris]GBF32198.1 hypothetical protein DCCM_0389 [Desulfocucumis palustris]
MPWVDKAIDEPMLAENIFKTMEGAGWKFIGDFYRVALCNKPSPNGGNAARKCGEASRSGGAGVTETWYEIGHVPGTVEVHYDMAAIPDGLEVFYKGRLLTGTGGPVSGSGILSFNYNPSLSSSCRAEEPDTEVMIRVTGPDNTGWSYQVLCHGLLGPADPGYPDDPDYPEEQGRIPEETLRSWKEDFRAGDFTEAVGFSCARHYIIEDKKKRRYGMAYAVRAQVSRATLVELGIYNWRALEFILPARRKAANLRWISLGQQFLNQYVKMAGCPVWHFYSLEDYYGPRIEIDLTREEPYSRDEILLTGMKQVGGGLPELSKFYPRDPLATKEFRLTDHLVRTGSDLLRTALDLENFSDFKSVNSGVYGKTLLYFDLARQSPIIPVRLRDTSINSLFNEDFDVSQQLTNWWEDSKVAVAGYYDDKSVFLTLRADESPYFEYPRGIPVLPMFFGVFEVPFFTDKGYWKDWNGNVALFGGTVVNSAEPVHMSAGCCRDVGEMPGAKPPPPPPEANTVETYLGYRGEEQVFYLMEPNGGQSLSPIRRDYEANRRVGDGLKNVIVKKDTTGRLFTPHFLSWLLPSNQMPVAENEADGFVPGREGAMLQRPGGRVDKEAYHYWFNPSRYEGSVYSSPAYILEPRNGVYGWLPNAIFTQPMSLVTGDTLEAAGECPPCRCAYKPSKYDLSLEIFELSREGCVVLTSIPVVHLYEPGVTDPSVIDLSQYSYIKTIEFSNGEKYHPHHPVNNRAVRSPLAVSYSYDPANLFLVTINNFFGGYAGDRVKLLSVRLRLGNRLFYPAEITWLAGVANHQLIINNHDMEDLICEQTEGLFDETFPVTELNTAGSGLTLRFYGPVLDDVLKADIPLLSELEYPYEDVLILPEDCASTIWGKVMYNFRLINAALSPLTFYPEDDDSINPPASAFRPVGVGIRMEDKKCPHVTLEQRNEILSRPGGAA